MAIADEFAFIRKLIPPRVHQSGLVEGIGDDGAIIQTSASEKQVICVDTMVEGVHFTKLTMDPFQVGYKALAANISDVAAMGGRPMFYLVSIAIPQTWSEEELLLLYKGMQALADSHQMDLIGGDTVSTPAALNLTVTVIGTMEDGNPLYRKNAIPGDLVFVSGHPGDSAAGLALLLERTRNGAFSDIEQQLVRKHQLPQPRVELGRILSRFHRIALNDISDGLASEAFEIAEASSVSLVIEAEKLPFSDELQEYNRNNALKWALYGGEDYELLGTCPPSDWDMLKRSCKEKGIPITTIGSVIDGKGSVYLRRNGRDEHLEKKGYNHFK